MGFQFNHVGGGTKTRRPITLHMKYNSACVQPVCFLVTEDAGEAELSLEELQVRAGFEFFFLLLFLPAFLSILTPNPSLTPLITHSPLRSTSSWRTRGWSGTNSFGPRKSW